MLVGAAAVDITPPLPMDLLGYVRRAVAAREVWEPLQARACLFRNEDATVVILTADLVGMTTAFASRVREAVAAAVGCRSEDVLVNCSHTHAAPWPGATIKLGGEADGWTPIELGYWESLPAAFASAAIQAEAAAVEARVAGGVGHAPGLAVNRRERTADGRTILGWNREGFIDDSVPTIRVDALEDGPWPTPIATLVGFGCHPVVVGPEVASVSSDFIGPLRHQLDDLLRPGSTTLFLQGAAGNVLPLEAFQDEAGAEEAMGERLALEAAHAIADADPRALTIVRSDYGSVTPIGLYRRRLADHQPLQPLRTIRRIVSFPLLAPPSVEALEAELVERRADLQTRRARGESRATTNPVGYHLAWLERTLAAARAGTLATALDGEIWAARIGDCAIVTAPGEIFGEIGHAVRVASPAPVTIFAGYSNGVLGYVATPEEYPFGGYEPAVSHRGYGHPAPFRPEVAGLIRDTALELLAELFATAPVATGEPS
jgi:hypothetical protein